MTGAGQKPGGPDMRGRLDRLYVENSCETPQAKLELLRRLAGVAVSRAEGHFTAEQMLEMAERAVIDGRRRLS